MTPAYKSLVINPYQKQSKLGNPTILSNRKQIKHEIKPKKQQKIRTDMNT